VRDFKVAFQEKQEFLEEGMINGLTREGVEK
jgi:hypothetical protein